MIVALQLIGRFCTIMEKGCYYQVRVTSRAIVRFKEMLAVRFGVMFKQ